jgi:hypothetical protein
MEVGRAYPAPGTVAAVRRVNQLTGWVALAAVCALILLEHLQEAVAALVDEVDLASIPVTVDEES